MMRHLALFIALAPFAAAGPSGTVLSGGPTATTDALAKEHKQVIPIIPGITVVAENLKTYLIPCHPDIPVTLYVEDRIIDVVGPGFWMEGDKKNPSARQPWFCSFNNDNEAGINYITIWRNPYLAPESDPNDRRNLNIICKGKVFSIEPYLVDNQAQANRMVYLVASGDGSRPTPQNPEGALRQKRAGDEMNMTDRQPAGPPPSVKQALNAEAAAASGGLLGISTVTPAIQNHGIEAQVLIGYLQKFKLLAGLPGKTMPGLEVWSQHYPAADFKGVQTGILDTYRDKMTEVIGFQCYIKNDSDKVVKLSDSGISVRVGEKVWKPKLCNPDKLALKPGEQRRIFAVFQEMDSARLNLKATKFQLITDLSLEVPAAVNPLPVVPSQRETITLPISVPPSLAGADAALVQVTRTKEVIAALFLVKNDGKEPVSLEGRILSLARKGALPVNAKEIVPARGWTVAPGETGAFSAYFHDTWLAGARWSEIKPTLSIEDSAK